MNLLIDNDHVWFPFERFQVKTDNIIRQRMKSNYRAIMLVCIQRIDTTLVSSNSNNALIMKKQIAWKCYYTTIVWDYTKDSEITRDAIKLGASLYVRTYVNVFEERTWYERVRSSSAFPLSFFFFLPPTPLENYDCEIVISTVISAEICQRKRRSVRVI